MGERYDVEVTLDDGVFPLVATPVGKKGIARALVRTGPGRAPADDTTPRELSGQVLMGTDLRPAESSRLDPKDPDDQQMLHLSGKMQPDSRAVNGKPFGPNTPHSPTRAHRARLRMLNMNTIHHHMPRHRTENPQARK